MFLGQSQGESQQQVEAEPSGEIDEAYQPGPGLTRFWINRLRPGEVRYAGEENKDSPVSPALRIRVFKALFNLMNLDGCGYPEFC